MGKNRKARNRGDAAKLEMTPMIDVVFQLLIFFIVTLKEEDILSNLNVSRPAPDPSSTPQDKVDLLTIQIGQEGWVLNGRPYLARAGGLQKLDQQLTRMASFSRSASVIIKCTGSSPHRYLIQVLNILSRENMTSISVFSL